MSTTSRKNQKVNSAELPLQEALEYAKQYAGIILYSANGDESFRYEASPTTARVILALVNEIEGKPTGKNVLETVEQYRKDHPGDLERAEAEMIAEGQLPPREIPMNRKSAEDTQGCAYSGELPPPGGLTCGHDESAPIHNPHDHRNFHHAFVSPRSGTVATFSVQERRHDYLLQVERRARALLAHAKEQGGLGDQVEDCRYILEGEGLWKEVLE